MMVILEPRSRAPAVLVGKNVNKVETAVRISTNLRDCDLVTLERSQHANREKAMVILRAKLYAIQIEKEVQHGRQRPNKLGV